MYAKFVYCLNVIIHNIDISSDLLFNIAIYIYIISAGFKSIGKGGNIDLNVVRLCFQVFLPDDSGKISRIVPPVVSLPIHDKSK